METIGQRVKRLRKKRNLSQRNLAIRTNLANSTINRIESDLVIPQGATLDTLSKFFNVSFEYLLNGADSNKDNNNFGLLKENEFQFALYDKVKGKDLSDKQKKDILNIIDLLTKEDDEK